ncbi:MAG: hypothetical protein Q9183_001441 [Haloplaca sp. 2 TL-2023]
MAPGGQAVPVSDATISGFCISSAERQPLTIRTTVGPMQPTDKLPGTFQILEMVL